MNRPDATLLPAVAAYLATQEPPLENVTAERLAVLGEIADYVRSRFRAAQPARLVFICTHNSRRSHLAQVWAHVAAHHLEVAGLTTYSGGTEATAFNPQAVAALGRAGLSVTAPQTGNNPVYQVWYSPHADPLPCFSKTFGAAPNPQRDFCAIMTCSEADQACPTVPGTDLRVALPYRDPKYADGTDREAAAYDQACSDISREMMALLSLVPSPS